MEKIEYYGEWLSIIKIAEKIGVSKNTVKRHYEKTKDIYETEKICNDIKRKQQDSLIKYEKDGKEHLLTIGAIAKLEGVDSKTLKRYFIEEKEINKAIAKCKESKIEYNGKLLTINAIAVIEKIKPDTLKRYYDKTKNIYEAIENYRKNKEKRENRKKEIEKEKEAKKNQPAKEIIRTSDGRTLQQVAEDENLSLTSLYRNYAKYKNANKAVVMTIMNKAKNRVENKEKNQQKNKAETSKTTKEKTSFTLKSGENLAEYCLKGRINDRIIRRKVEKGETIEQAIEEYKEEGQNTPTQWKYESNGVLLKHFCIKNGIEIREIQRYMKKEEIHLDEAIEKYLIRRNAGRYQLNKNWTEELYYLLKDEEVQKEYKQYKDTFYIDEKEEKCIEETKEQTQKIQRELLLMEISQVLKTKKFSRQEEIELLKSYKITANEIEEIFLGIHERYKDKVLMGQEQLEYKRRQESNQIIRQWYYLGQKEREDIMKRVSKEELNYIEKTSNQIVSYQNAIIISQQNEKERTEIK